MSPRRTMRRALSLVMMLTTIGWTQCGLAMVPMLIQGAHCRIAAHAAHPAPSESSQPHGKHACCPMHAALLLISQTQLPCCADSQQPALPLEFLVASGKSRAMQLGIVAAAAGWLATPTQNFVSVVNGKSPPFVPSVFDKKADLRI